MLLERGIENIFVEMDPATFEESARFTTRDDGSILCRDNQAVAGSPIMIRSQFSVSRKFRGGGMFLPFPLSGGGALG